VKGKRKNGEAMEAFVSGVKKGGKIPSISDKRERGKEKNAIAECVRVSG